MFRIAYAPTKRCPILETGRDDYRSLVLWSTYANSRPRGLIGLFIISPESGQSAGRLARHHSLSVLPFLSWRDARELAPHEELDAVYVVVVLIVPPVSVPSVWWCVP